MQGGERHFFDEFRLEVISIIYPQTGFLDFNLPKKWGVRISRNFEFFVMREHIFTRFLVPQKTRIFDTFFSAKTERVS